MSSVNNRAIAGRKTREAIIAGGGAEVKQLNAPVERMLPNTTEQRPVLGTKHVLRIADKGFDAPIKSETRFEEGKQKSESREDSVVTTLPIRIKRDVEDLKPPKRLVSGARVI